MALRAGESVFAGLASNVITWVNLSWIRCAIDGAVSILLLRAASECRVP